MQTSDENFYCPITYGIMMDPVIGSDGHTYERNAIETWLYNNSISPLTKQTMFVNSLVPNIALRNTIQQYLAKHPEMKDHRKVKLNSEISRSITIGSYILPDSSMYVKLAANEISERKPSVFVFILDVSGSMNTEASTKSALGESDGFSRLDLVKHSVRTVIEVLEPQDKICLITFSDDAKVKLDLTSMDDYGKTRAISILNSIQTEGMTNIWDGLRVGLLNVQKITDPNVNISMMMLTDGEPNKNPPRGIVPSLETVLGTMKIQQAFTINTFGFGYSLDSNLLSDIALVGSGSYCYIPDSSMVGTIFVNYLSNVLSTYLSNSRIVIKAYGTDGTDGIEIVNKQVGSIQFQQPKELVFQLDESVVNNDFNISLWVGETLISHHDLYKPHNKDLISSTIPTIVRNKIINTIYNLMNKVDSHNLHLQDVNFTLKLLYEDVEHTLNTLLLYDEDKAQIRNYLQDWNSSGTVNKGGQIKEAFSCDEWYKKWGAHFLRSIMNAYKNQQCNNFKDPGVQNFGGDLFVEIRQKADGIFCMLEPPKPSILHHRNSSSNYVAPTTMHSYYDQSGSCYDGNGMVVMADGSYMPVYKLKKGMMVKSRNIFGNDFNDRILCIVKTKIPMQEISMCMINNLAITPWHPIYHNNEWVFPINLTNEEDVSLDYIYNVLLESGNTIYINGLALVTLAHNLNDPIVAHPYYGTSKIVDDLSQMDGWEKGEIILTNPIVMRTDGFVTKLSNGSVNN